MRIAPLRLAVLPSLLLAAPAAAQVEGSGLAAPVRLEADGAPVDSGESIAHSGPLFTDVTGDGVPDLLVGNFRGNIQVYANVGQAGAPRFEGRGLLQAAGEDLWIHNW
jgi:hypothetical protein